MTLDVNPEREYETAMLTCGQCGRETLHPLEDNLCRPCILAGSLASPVKQFLRTPYRYVVMVPFRFVTRDAADQAAKFYSEAYRTEVKVEELCPSTK